MTMRRPGDVHVALGPGSRPRELFAVLDARRSYHIRQRSAAQALAEVGVDITETHPHSLIRSSFVTSTLWSLSDVKLASTYCLAPGSRLATPTNLPNGASTASNACASSATTSQPASPISSTACRPKAFVPEPSEVAMD